MKKGDLLIAIPLAVFGAGLTLGVWAFAVWFWNGYVGWKPIAMFGGLMLLGAVISWLFAEDKQKHDPD